VITFSFQHENPVIDKTLKVGRDMIFEEPEVEIVTTYQPRQIVIKFLHYYHVTEEEYLVEENPCNIQILKVEGERSRRSKARFIILLG
jgi:hypothetical protein